MVSVTLKYVVFRWVACYNVDSMLCGSNEYYYSSFSADMWLNEHAVLLYEA